MVSEVIQTGLRMLIEVDFPISDLLVAIPFAFPAIIIGILTLLYQRFLPRTERKRNAILAGGIASILFAAFLLLYASYGSMPWVDGVQFGSYEFVMGVLREIHWILFSSVGMGLLYLLVVSLILASLTVKVLTPPDPDFVALSEGLKEARVKMTAMKDDSQKLEGENKQLKEFVAEKETALTSLQEQLDKITAEVAEREKRISEMEASLAEPVVDRSPELLQTIEQKERIISDLEKRVAQLQENLAAASAPAPAAPVADGRSEQLEITLQETQAKLQDYLRRAETAAEVSDSVISDLAELMSQVESSRLDSAAKVSVTNLIKNVGRAIGRVSETPPSGKSAPKVELIGAVMIVHEIVDGIKRMIRDS
ncbi:MAG: hypothetical protein EAX95_05665 [Candidatus Thorarchaeota archaeon]|nr:hypothetical protein [Candidatus Thorarchaeota archaeon]